MGFDARFTLGLIGWLAAALLALIACIAAWYTPGLTAARLVVALALAGTVAGLWWHVSRTNRMLARFIEALRHREFATRFGKGGGAGFDQLGAELDAAMQALQRERLQNEREQRFLEAMVDDMPVALLIVDPVRGVTPGNKLARRLFGRETGIRPQDFSLYGASFAERLAHPQAERRELLLLRLEGGLQRTIVRVATLERLGNPVHLVSLEPVQGTLDAVEMAAQTDLVRVLTHEILNSLTPVMSLSRTLDGTLRESEPDLTVAREAAATLARRTQGLLSFIESYRAVAHSPIPRPRRVAAQPLAAELERLFKTEWPECSLATTIEDGLELTADPDLLAQVLINLLRNAAQATHHLSQSRVLLSMMIQHEQVIIAVEDNGPGIPEAKRSEVFLPFYTTKREGSGIGLNLVRQIAVASGWSLEIATGSLGGALFRLGVPR